MEELLLAHVGPIIILEVFLLLIQSVVVDDRSMTKLRPILVVSRQPKDKASAGPTRTAIWWSVLLAYANIIIITGQVVGYCATGTVETRKKDTT